MRALPALFAAALLLAACATPQEACINRALREVRTFDELIAEQRRTLERGYGLIERTEWRWEWQLCDPGTPATATAPATPPRWCWENEPYTVTDRVPIDPAAEQRKLDGLLARRAEVARAAELAVADCRVRHPE